MTHTNRLAKETSPYLLQHAHNPVDWYAWGPEAFEAARTQDKPIFLSVGYSTCYWCHVMERQSFENEAIAAEMNKRFINIKVDREERPDVDQLYMTAVQVLTRHGGWPMSVFLLPDLRPFYGGTYFPPEDVHGRPGFVTVLRAIEDAYRNRREDVNRSAEQIVDILQQIATPQAATRPITIDLQFIENLLVRSTSDYDPANGGYGSAPKFPRETLLELLLQSKNPNFKSQIRHTLDALANGGIRDHLGGGFHRYSTDAHWLVPHFEIMLYDNAMLGWCYAEASVQFDEPRYKWIAQDIFYFIQRSMTSVNGAFYTALDAEVDAAEGGPYLWTEQEIVEVLGSEDAKSFNRIYGVDQGPNFADPHGGSGVPDKNVLYLPGGALSTEDEVQLLGKHMHRRMLKAREKRKQPLLDTKIITSWNALMIRALAHAGKVLKEPELVQMAANAADFLLRHHRREDGTLLRTSRDGQAKYDAFLDDYAFLAQALLALHEAGAPGHLWKEHAMSIAQVMVQKFAAPGGGFYFTQEGADDLIVRQMVASDSPLPSGNGVAAMVMLELDDREAAERTMRVFANSLSQQGEGMSAMAQAAMLYVQKNGPLKVEASAKAERPLSPRELAERVVGISTVWHSATKLEVKLHILKPFHINSHQPAKGMIATELRLQGVEGAKIEYPLGEIYQGQAGIIVEFEQAVTKMIRAALRYQACDESACLEPITKTFELTPSHSGRGSG